MSSFYRRILMFAPAFAPFANPEAIVNSKLALAFLDGGWEIDVISRNLIGISKYDYGSDWIEPWLPLKRITHEVNYNSGGKLTRYISTVNAAAQLGWHFIDGCRWGYHALDLGLRLHRQKPYQVILSRSGPDSAHLPAMVLSQKTGLPWVANWNDASGDKNLPPYGEGPDARLGFFCERFLRDVARRANWHTFPSDRLKNYLCLYLGDETKKKGTTIPHAALRSSLRTKKQRNEDLTICYAGNISIQRNPEVFLRGLSDFLKGGDALGRVKLEVIGLTEIAIQELAIKLGIEKKVQMLGPMGYKETLRKLESSDVLLILEAPCQEGIYLPAKFVDYVQAKRPILAVTPKKSTVRDFMKTYGGGLAVDCDSPKEIYDALKRLHTHWKDGTLEKRYMSDILYNLFSPEKITSCYEEIFGRIGVPRAN